MFGAFDFYSKIVPVDLFASLPYVFPKNIKGIMISNNDTVVKTVLVTLRIPGGNPTLLVTITIPAGSTSVFPVRFYSISGPASSTTVNVYELY